MPQEHVLLRMSYPFCVVKVNALAICGLFCRRKESHVVLRGAGDPRAVLPDLRRTGPQRLHTAAAVHHRPDARNQRLLH